MVLFMVLVLKMNITNIIKTSLKYPQSNLENVVIYTAFLVIFSFLSLLGYSKIVSEKIIENHDSDIIVIQQFANNFSQIHWSIYIFVIICAIIVLIIISGYVYRIYEGSEDLPNFNDLKQLLTQGIKVIVTSIVYYIIPYIILIVGSYLNGTIVDILNIIGFILLIIVQFFIQPMAIANMASNNNFKQAFDLREIIEKIKEISITKYVGTIIFSTIIQAIILASFGVICFILMFLAIFSQPFAVAFITIILALGFFIYAYLEIFSVKIYQLLYKKDI